MSKPKDAPEMRGPVKHVLTKSRNPILAKITRCCVLNACIADPNLPRSRNTREATLGMQYAMRGQYYQAITFNPKMRRKYTYSYNCPPSGFHAVPYTKLCKNPRICPWCYSRRLEDVFRALTAPPFKIRNMSKLVLWRRNFAADAKLPFFRPQAGPHQWFKAAATVQLVMPIFNANTRSIYLSHIGLQIVPKTVTDVTERLNKRCGDTPLATYEFPSCKQDNIYKALASATRVSWMDLYRPDNLPFFIDLLGMYPKRQLLRINQYKPKGDLRGDRLPTIPEGIDESGTAVLDTECPF